MSNAKSNHQGYILFSLLKAAGKKGITRAEAAKALGVRESSVPVYFYGLRTLYNAEIEVVKQGRKVVSYTLLNANDCTITENGRRGTKTATKPKSKTKPLKSVSVKTVKATNTPAVKESTPILDSDLEISEVDDAELEDLKASLGIG